MSRIEFRRKSCAGMVRNLMKQYALVTRPSTLPCYTEIERRKMTVQWYELNVLNGAYMVRGDPTPTILDAAPISEDILSSPTYSKHSSLQTGYFPINKLLRRKFTYHPIDLADWRGQHLDLAISLPRDPLQLVFRQEAL